MKISNSVPLEEEIVTSFDQVLRLLVYLSLRNKDKCFDTRALVTTINQLLLILVSKCVTARQINLLGLLNCFW